MMELEVGRQYSTEELARAIGISKSVFTHKKNQYLSSLQLAYTYEVEYKGRAMFYTITEKIGEYEKPARKNQRDKTNQVIKKFINEVIDEDPVQTAANINRRAWEGADKNPSEVVLLGLKDSTTGEYIRLNLREMYGTQEGMGGTEGMIERKVWCYLDSEHNCYIEMSEEMVDKFYACFDEARKDQKQIDVDILADYDSGLITREEMKDRLANASINVFKEGKKLFYKKYGYYPIKVPVYVKSAWKDDSKRYKEYSL